jgi:hypothetical protein
MLRDELRTLLAKQPFVPLRLRMCNGRIHEIKHAGTALVDDCVVALLVERNGVKLFRLISLPDIREVEQLSAS